jgi:hypothetical protein
MRKRDPNQVVAGFQTLVSDSLENWHVVVDALHAHPLSTQRLVSRDAFLRLAVGWEVFRSDWHIAATAKDTSVFAATGLKGVTDLAKSRRELKGIIPYIRVDIPKHLPLANVKDALDPDGGNMSLSSKKLNAQGTAQWQTQARAHLSSDFASVITRMPVAHLKILSLVEHLRDCIVHSSQRSADTLKGALAAIDPDDAARYGVPTRRMGPQRVPTYLHSEVCGQRRVAHFHDRLGHIAGAMRT